MLALTGAFRLVLCDLALVSCGRQLTSLPGERTFVMDIWVRGFWLIESEGPRQREEETEEVGLFICGSIVSIFS